jgi:hypothetical protein
MKTSTKGYLKNSPDVNKPRNVIEGGDITMKGVEFKVLGEDDKGYRKLMYPGNDYNFRHAKYVVETPMKNKTTKLPIQELWRTK